MTRALGWKLLALGMVGAVLLAALLSVEATIRERAAFREQAVRDIADSYAGPQRLSGPVLVLAFEEHYTTTESTADGKGTRRVEHKDAREVVVFPDDLRVEGGLQTQSRYRGLHKVQVYELQGTMRGGFTVPPETALRSRADSRLQWGHAYVSLAVSDVRGLTQVPKLTVDGVVRALAQGTRQAKWASGVHAMLPTPAAGQPLAFQLELTLAGSQGLELVPLGRHTAAKLKSAWPHPQFAGRFLPRQREVSAQGFWAEWDINELATNARTQTLADPASAESLAVNLIEPVSIYLQAERAVKYGGLFIALTFGVFFLYEALKNLRLHVVQYALSGSGMALFFLLLISLSEHIAFGWAYLLSASACVLLYAVYLSAVLKSWQRGASFAAGLALLYAMLYGLLRSEQNAFVLGSLLLFGILAATMIGTRHVDWHRVGESSSTSTPSR